MMSTLADSHSSPKLSEVHHKLIEALSALDTSRLDAPIVPGFSSLYVTLHGLVQHTPARSH